MKVCLHKGCSPQCPHYCYSCGTHEPLPDKWYRMCGECLHVFVTEAELVREHNALLAEIRQDVTNVGVPVPPEGVPPDVTTGKQVFCCPKCIHDF
jgi:hypothetical protein